MAKEQIIGVGELLDKKSLNGQSFFRILTIKKGEVVGQTLLANDRDDALKKAGSLRNRLRRSFERKGVLFR